MGINVVTANNSCLSGDKQLRNQIRNLESSKKVHLLREVTVALNIDFDKLAYIFDGFFWS